MYKYFYNIVKLALFSLRHAYGNVIHAIVLLYNQKVYMFQSYYRPVAIWIILRMLLPQDLLKLPQIKCVALYLH